MRPSGFMPPGRFCVYMEPVSYTHLDVYKRQALGHNPGAPSPFVTWQFTEGENGHRDYYWGRYRCV